MAQSVLIPLKAVFDDKGIKQAQASFGQLGSSLKGIVGAAGIAVGLGAIVSSLKDATKAASEDVKSQALLAQQLRNTVGASQEQIDSVEKSIAAMELQAAVADDVIRPAFATLVRATGDVTQATQLTNLALDVAAGTGKDLGAVSIALGKAINGSTTSLTKLGINLKGASDPIAELTKQFNGAAAAAADNDPYAQLTVVFGRLQEQIGTYLLPYLEDFANYITSPEGQAALTEFGDGVGEIADNVLKLGKNLGSEEFLSGLASFSSFLAQLSGGEFGGALNTINDRQTELSKNLETPAMRDLRLSTKAKSSNKEIAAAAKKEIAAVKKAEKETRAAYNRYAALEEVGKSLKMNIYSTGTPLKGSDFLPEETDGSKTSKKVDTAAKLAAADAKALAKSIADAKALAKSIADANAEMEKAKAEGIRKAAQATQEAAEAAASAAKEIVDQLQSVSDAAQTEANKYTQALTPLAPTVIEVYQTAVDNLARLQEESQRTLDDMAKGMADVKAQANSAATAFKDLAKTSAPIGAWEQKLNESFANLTASAGSAFNNKLITEDAYKNLKAYAAREKALLTDIAKRRDALAEKISLAKTLYASTKQAIIGFGSITGLLKQQSETITETSTKIIDGIAVTFSKTFEKITSTNLVDEYKKIIDKTKAFAGNLKMLRDQGLNKELFAQIVGAGVDVAGETAAAIAAGGPAVVTELNGLFEELQTIGSQVAETTTVVMYNNGKDVAGGFIEGLISEDQALADAATSIAAIFADTFQIQLTSAMDAVLAAMKAQLQLAIDAAMAALAKAKAELQAAADSANKAAADAAAALAKAKNVAQAAAVEAAGPSKGLYLSQFVAAQNAFMDSQIALGNTPDFSVANGGSFGRSGYTTNSNTIGRSGYTTNSNTINVSVNAGAIANKQELPQMIVDALGTYTRQSGAGGLVRILGIQ